MIKPVVLALTLVTGSGCSQVVSMDAVSFSEREVEIVRNELLNALDDATATPLKVESLERIYAAARKERAESLENYLDRAEDLRESSWEAWKTAGMWAERIGLLVVLIPLL